MTKKQKAKFYDVMSTVLRDAAMLLPIVGIIGGAVLIPTATLAVGLITAFAGCAFGAACFVSSNISKVYADGYQAEAEMEASANNVTMENFTLEHEATNTYSDNSTYTVSKKDYSNEEDLSK